MDRETFNRLTALERVNYAAERWAKERRGRRDSDKLAMLERRLYEALEAARFTADDLPTVASSPVAVLAWQEAHEDAEMIGRTRAHLPEPQASTQP